VKQIFEILNLAARCLLGISLLSIPCAASDFFVGNFFGSTSDVLHYDGTTGAFQSIFVPHGSGGLTFPLGGGFGPDGNLYVANSDNDTVVRYDGTTGAFLNVFAMAVEDAAGLVFGPDGNLYVADSTAPGAVTKLNGTTGALIGELTGGGLSDPEGLVFGPDGNLYVANTDGNDIVRFNGTTGAFMDIFVAAGSGGLQGPRGVTFGPDGNLYVTSAGNTGGVLRYSSSTGAFLNAFVGPGSDLSLPRQLVFGPDSNLYVGNFGIGNVLRYNGTSGAFIDTFIPTGSGGLGGPTFLVFHEGASTVPEPAALILVGVGLVALGVTRNVKRRSD
jgi:DNA-binding beta-propeller fold protein YncE